METTIQSEPNIDHLSALGTQIRWKEKENAEAGTVLLMPHTDGPPIHYHPKQEEQFLIVKGKLDVYKNEKWITLKAGDSIVIPKGTPHSYRNASDGVVLFDFCITPRVRFTEMITSMDTLVQQGKINGKNFKSIMHLSRVMADYPDVTQSVKPPQFVINTMAALSKFFFK